MTAALTKAKRTGYIDIIKFLFAIIIFEFHVGSGIFPGGRLAVEGFFMISGYLMMCTIAKNKHPEDNLGISTVRFLANKYKSLFYYLFPSVIIAYAISCVQTDKTFFDALIRFPLTVFDIFPLRVAGYEGSFTIGISWYLSAMFLALGILYPLIKKFGQNFTLTVCPLLVFLIYGLLSSRYGHLAVATEFLENSILQGGLIRGLAGCSAGVVLYEIVSRFKGKSFKVSTKIVFTIIEIAGFIFAYHLIRNHPKSSYDFVATFVVFGILLIGIGQLSFSSTIFSGNWTKPLGTCSLLIVLNHYRINVFLRDLYGKDYFKTDKVFVLIAAVAGVCIVVWIIAKLLEFLFRKVSKISLYKKEIKE